MIPPASYHSYSFQWIPRFIVEAFVNEPSIALEILSDKTLSWKFTTSCALPFAKCWVANTSWWYGKDDCKFPMPYIPKSHWDCIQTSWTSTALPIDIYITLPVLFTMNASHPQPYLFSRIRKIYIPSLVFEPEMSNL